MVLLNVAYFKSRRFALIGENYSYFVSRLKKSVSPVMAAELQE